MTVSGGQTLGEILAKVRGDIGPLRERVARGQTIGEQNTKAILIDPVLAALGWDLGDLDEVIREYRRKPQDNPVDYALAFGQPVLFIEAKALGSDLLPRRYASQVLAYASMVGVAWCLLTDGDEYRLYNSHALSMSMRSSFARSGSRMSTRCSPAARPWSCWARSA
jgi:hypothetical protein